MFFDYEQDLIDLLNDFEYIKIKIMINILLKIDGKKEK